MLRTTFADFARLRPSVKAILSLHWIYSAVGAMTGVFVNIYLYQRFESVLFNVVAMMLYFFGCAIGFSLIGYLASRYRINMKWGYYVAFLLLSSSFLFLYGETTALFARLFMFQNGIGLGLYWVTLHTFELTETKNEERDYYSSVLSAGDQIIELIAPACATILFYLSSDMLHLGTYTLLFVVAPLLYLLGIPLFARVRAYRPTPITLEDTKHFLHDKNNIRAQVYLFGNSLEYTTAVVILPIVAVSFLGSAKHVGIFNALFAVISACVLLLFAKVRHQGNRLKFLKLTTFAAAAIALFMAGFYGFTAFLIFSLLSLIVNPLKRVSEHVIDLETMETLGREGSDFFPTMIFRDAAYGVWRLIALSCFALFITVFGEGEEAIRVGFVALALAALTIYFGATLIYPKHRTPSA